MEVVIALVIVAAALFLEKRIRATAASNQSGTTYAPVAQPDQPQAIDDAASTFDPLQTYDGDPMGITQAQPANPLQEFMQAIDRFEGGKPGNINTRNNNPGNLRAGIGQTGENGGFAVFSSQDDGYSALSALIRHYTTAHPKWDFYDFFTRYLGGDPDKGIPAPGDQGDANTYAEFVAAHVGAEPTAPVSSVLIG